MTKSIAHVEVGFIAEKVAACFHSDSGIPPKDSLEKITEALRKDLTSTDRTCRLVPTDDEIYCLVTEGEEDEHPDLVRRFPHLIAVLNSFF